jgi:hypothetical protein
MRQIYTLLLLYLISISAITQEPDLTIRKCIDESTTPLIEGTIDEVWNYVDETELSDYSSPAPTILEAAWKMMWSDTSLIILISIDDDSHCDQWCTNLNDYESDRVEVLIDVNEELWDGLGANPEQSPGGPSSGHYQYYSQWQQGEDQYSGVVTQWPSNNPYSIGYLITDNYFDHEFSIPWTSLADCTGVAFTPADGKLIGIQIVMVDVDNDDVNTIKYLNWKAINAWVNMDNAGVIKLSDAPVNTGIHNLAAINTIKVYPNPAKNYITIDTEPGNTMEVIIYNSIAQEVLCIEKYNGERIYLAGLKTGLYYVTVYDNRRKLFGKNKFTIIK